MSHEGEPVATTTRSRSKPAAPRQTKAQLAQAEAQAKFVMGLDDNYIACRQRHQLPPLAFTKTGKLPKGVYAVGPYANGVYDLVRICPSCGLLVSLYTGAGGKLLEAKGRRRYPPGYLAKGMGRIPSRLAMEEGLDRISSELYAGAVRPSGEEN